MPTGQRSPGEHRKDIPGGSQDVEATGGVGRGGQAIEGSGPQGHDTSMRCGVCGEGFARPEGLDEHMADAHVRRKG
jgi:hypothetical protein